MMAKVSVKIPAELNKELSIISILEDKTKEQFISTLLTQSIQPFKEKWDKHKFSYKDTSN